MLAIATKGFLLHFTVSGHRHRQCRTDQHRPAQGLRPALLMGLGSCFGDLFYALLSLLGMSLLFSFTPVRWVMWLGGGAVLLWLAWKMARAAWHEFHQPSSHAAARPKMARRAAVRPSSGAAC
jgi:L-lysine exporter family protein LysE/ArgO